jgi:hypothetical protein
MELVTREALILIALPSPWTQADLSSASRPLRVQTIILSFEQ